MPFRLAIDHVAYHGSELSVTGRVVEGAYMGPEAAFLVFVCYVALFSK